MTPSPYDRMSAAEQAVERARSAAEIQRLLAAQDLEAQFVAEGRSWVVMDDAGRIVVHNRDGRGSAEVVG